MMTQIDQSKLDSLSRRFLTEVREAFPDRCLDIKVTDRLKVVFPAEHPDVGEIHVWLDREEVTVGIGHFYHTHFETYLDESLPKDDAEAQAVAEAIAFIRIHCR